MPRIELRDGQWADLRERISHRSDKDLRIAYRRGRDDAEQQAEFDTILVRAFVRHWSVLDPDGTAIPIEDPDAIDRAPEDVADALVVAAAELWTGATAPNAPTPPSSDGSPSAGQ